MNFAGQFFGQSCMQDKFTDICNKLVKIDSTEYKSKFVKEQRFPKTKKYKKIKGTISIPTSNKTETFKDDYRPDSYATYSLFGEDTILHWVIVKETHEHDDDAYIINTQTSKVWNLLAKPVFYVDKIICFERPPDNPDRIHVLDVKGNEIISDKYFKICNCSANFGGILKYYYRNKTLYINDGVNYWKVNIDI
jgi:hypothetical protein